MPRSVADLQAIKTELTNDPNGLGLTLLAEDDVTNAEKLNEVRDSQQVDRQAIPSSEIAKAIDRDEYAALSAADRDWLQMIAATETVDPSAGNEVREGFLQLFAAGSETRANIQALLTESASRITEMFRQGVLEASAAVTPSDIANARNI